MMISEKVDNRTHVPMERLIEKPPIPTDMKIELTSRCNLKCSFCATKSKLRAAGDMDYRTYKILIDACAYLGVEEVGLFLLGESFLLKNLDEYVFYAKAKGIKYVYITSNGVLCKPKIMNKLFHAGLDSLKISLNAGTKKSYKKVTGVNAFQKVFENILWIAYNKPDTMNFAVSCVYDKDHADEMNDLADIMKEVTEDFYFLPKYNQAGHVKGDIRGNVGRLENKVKNIPCWELFNTMRITWDGFLTACCFDHREEFKIGSISGITLENLWHSKKFVELRKKHLSGDVKNSICKRCLIGD